MFGGAFDPPHNAHRALVQVALDQLQLDAMQVLPTGHAWHKPRGLTDGDQRLAMARLAFADMPCVQVDGRELQDEHPGAQLFLLMGADQAAALQTWHAWQEIVQSAIICIAGRAQTLSASGIFDASKYPGGRFETLHMPPLNVSATTVRCRIAAHLGIDHLVPAGVARYIDQHHLYLAA